MSVILSLLPIALLSLMAPVHAAEVPLISLDQAVAAAIHQNPEARVASLEVRAASARSRQVRSYFFPSVKGTGAALWWDSPLEVQLFDDDPCADLEDFLQEYCDDMISRFKKPIVLREQTTQQVSVELKQPLNGLWNVAEGLRATTALERASKAAEEATQARVAVDAVAAWLQALETRKLLGVAQQVVTALEAHTTRASAFQSEGLVGRNDILRLEVALNEAKLGHMRAEVGVVLSEKALALRLGAEDRRLSPTELKLSSLPPLAWDPDSIEHLARSNPKVRELDAQVQAAEAAHRKAMLDILPQAGAVASWTHNWGLGTMSAAQEWYVGLGLQWEIVTWGRRVQEVKEADARAGQARIGSEGMARGEALQAEAALEDARIARRAVDSHARSLVQAEENLQLVTARYEVLSASTTDLLEAETLASKARADNASAVFDYLLAIARAQAALGLEIRPLAGVELGAR